MANQKAIKIIYYETGETDFTALIYKPDDTIRQTAFALSDTGHLGLYSNPDSISIELGDTVVIYKGSAIYDGFVYMPGLAAFTDGLVDVFNVLEGLSWGQGSLDGSINQVNNRVLEIRAKTNSLNFVGDNVKATLESGAVKLAPDGWDDLAIDEPSGNPDGWTVPQKLMWLVMRFLNQHSSDNFNGIMVKKSDGSASTGQIVTEGGGIKTVSKAQ